MIRGKSPLENRMQTTRIDSARAINTVASAKSNTLVDLGKYNLEITRQTFWVRGDKIGCSKDWWLNQELSGILTFFFIKFVVCFDLVRAFLQKLATSAEHVVYPNCSECQNTTKTTICVHSMFCRYHEQWTIYSHIVG